MLSRIKFKKQKSKNKKETNMNDIVVIGGSEFNLGFQLAGIRNIVTIEQGVGQQVGQQAEKQVEQQTEQKFRELFENPKTGIILTDDKTVQQLTQHFREMVENSAKPSVVVFSLEGKDEGLRKMIIKAIGVDLWEK